MRPPTRSVGPSTLNSSPTCTARQSPPSIAAVCGSAVVERRLRVGLHQSGKALGIGVIGMLMGDQDRRETRDALEPVGEVAGIEERRATPKSASRHE